MSTEPLDLLRYVRKFIDLHGGDFLTKLSETQVVGARWHCSTHGGVIRVEGAHDELFERLVCLIPCPPEADPARFQAWAEERIEHLHWYMEKTNTGKRMHTTSSAKCVVAVFIRRVGQVIQSLGQDIPQPEQVIPMLERFALDVERYVKVFGDQDLRYVRAVKIYRIPRVKKDDEFVIGLDVLPTLLGLEGAPTPINPLTLLRGVIGELTEILDIKRELGQGKSRHVRKQAAAFGRLVERLDEVCARIDVERPSLENVRAQLRGLRPKAKREAMSSGSRLATIGLVLACCVFAWYLAR